MRETLKTHVISALIISCLLMLAVIPFSAPRAGAQALVSDLTLSLMDYVNNSTTEAVALLDFSGDPYGLGDVTFTWYDPGGKTVHNETSSPDLGGVAKAYYRVTTTGQWSVKASYDPDPGINEMRSLRVFGDRWGPGEFHVPSVIGVGEGVLLTIEAGTTVLFNPDGGLRVKGRVNATGNLTSPITFTANSSSPSPGFWDAVRLVGSADGSSEFRHTRVLFAKGGVDLLSASVVIENSSFQADLFGVFADASMVRLQSARFHGNSQAIVANKSTVEAYDLQLQSNTWGLIIGNDSQVSLVGGFVLDTISTALQVQDSRLAVRSTAFSGNDVTLYTSNANGEMRNVSISASREGVRATRSSNVLIVNSSIGTSIERFVSAYSEADVFLENVSLPWTGAQGFFGDQNATIYFRNYLRVQVKSHDNGSLLLKASVRVLDNGNRIFEGLTDGAGETALILVTDRVFKGILLENTTTIRVSYDALKFADNGRSVSMEHSHTEFFEGSVYDNDRDGEPDFSDPDDDNDGLTDSVELILNTDPMNPDTDHDGMPDGWEFTFQLNPRDSVDALLDYDEDGLTNLAEYRNGTNPRDRDTDNDRMDDGWEVRYSLDPNDPSDATADADEDGFTNIQEYIAGTDPRDSNSFPRSPASPFAQNLFWFLLALVSSLALLSLTMLIRRERRNKGK